MARAVSKYSYVVEGQPQTRANEAFEGECYDRTRPEVHAGAIELSAETSLVKKAGGVFGTVIVNKDGEILAEGANRVVAENDPTWHGEMEAIRKACKKVGSFKLDDCTLYSSAERCPMCAAAAYWAGIKKIYFAATVGDALSTATLTTR